MKIITKEEYHRFLAEAKELIALDPDPLTEEGERLEIVAVLIEEYEKRCFKFLKPSRLQMILFRISNKYPWAERMFNNWP